MNYSTFSKSLNSVDVPTPAPETIIASASQSIFAQNADWATARSAGTGVLTSVSGANAFLFGGQYQVRRAFAQFDFSSLSGTVATATLKIALIPNSDPGTFVTAQVQLCSNSGTLIADDFDNFSGDFGSSSAYSLDGSIRVFAIPLNASAIAAINAASGNLRFVVREKEHDYDNTTPTITGAAVGTAIDAEIDLTY